LPYEAAAEVLVVKHFKEEVVLFNFLGQLHEIFVAVCDRGAVPRVVAVFAILDPFGAVFGRLFGAATVGA